MTIRGTRRVFDFIINSRGTVEGRRKYSDGATQCDTIVHKERQALLRFLAFIALTTTLPPNGTAPRCRWSLLSCRVQSIERAHNGECPPISSFRLNVVQVLPVQLERDLYRIETGPRTYGSMLAFSTLDAIHQINDLEWLCGGVKKVVFQRSFRAHRCAISELS